MPTVPRSKQWDGTNYLEEKLRFPFRAKCICLRATSPLRKGEKVEVTDLAPQKSVSRKCSLP